MRLKLIISSLCICSATAYSGIALDETELAGSLEARRFQEKSPILTRSFKPLDLTGKHAFVPPDFTAGELRGPCPMLNALANHNYLPHSGVFPMLKTVEVLTQEVGVGIDLALLLAVIATAFGGNLLSLNPGFSIGGKSPRVQNLFGNFLGLLGEPSGISNTHGLIEGDSSLARSDLYDTGDAETVNVDLFEKWYNMTDTNKYDFDNLALRANTRLEESKAENPYFFYGPLSGLIVRNAGYLFAARVLPGDVGYLTRETMKDFWAVSGEPGTFTAAKGHEAFPENWTRRSTPYGLVQMNLDIVSIGMKYPSILSIGGNVGRVNSFAGVDLKDVTGGVLNTLSFLKGNNLMCFVLQVVKTLSPSFLATTYSVVDGVLGKVLDALPFTSLKCPAWAHARQNEADLKKFIVNPFPGAVRSGRAW